MDYGEIVSHEELLNEALNFSDEESIYEEFEPANANDSSQITNATQSTGSTISTKKRNSTS